MNELLQKLREPFHPRHIEWKPGATTKDKKKALALAYADLRAYQNRLDEVCGLEWSVNYTPWGDRIVCHLTIGKITRSSTGEPAQDNPKVDGTVAEAQAFKRACSMFGLGRYLYDLPMTWQEYDAQRKQFTEHALQQLHNIANSHHQRNGDHPPTPPDEERPRPPRPKPSNNGQSTKNQRSSASPPASLDEVDAEPMMDFTGLLHNTDINMSDAAVNFIKYLREKHQRSNKPMSEKQYRFAVSLVNDVCGSDRHTAIFQAIFGERINSDNRPGWMAKELIDFLHDSDHPERQAKAKEALGNINAAIGIAAGQLELPV